MLNIKWIVVEKKETFPVEATPFDNFEDAKVYFDRVKINWTGVYLCQVVDSGSRVS